MSPPLPKSLRYLVAAAFCALASLSVWAQDGLGPISPELAPALTDNLAAPPVSTLDPDFLVPSRSFTYDATGASLSSNALNAESTTFNLNSSTSQTDTAVRDSSQAGQWNPYSAAAMRLAAKEAFSGQGKATGSPEARDLNAENYGASVMDWHSTWGPTAAAGSLGADRSSWSMKPAAVRWGVGTEEQSADFPEDSHMGASEALSSGSTPGVAFSGSASDPSRTSSADPGCAMRRRTSANTRQRGARASNADDRESVRLHAAIAAPSPTTAASLFAFSPGSTFAAPGLGTSPFNSPGFGEQSFLQPSITNVSAMPPGPRTTGLRRQAPVDHALGISDPLSAVEGLYRRGSLYDQAKPASSIQRKRHRGNPYIQGASGDADNAYGLLNQP